MLIAALRHTTTQAVAVNKSCKYLHKIIIYLSNLAVPYAVFCVFMFHSVYDDEDMVVVIKMVIKIMIIFSRVVSQALKCCPVY